MTLERRPYEVAFENWKADAVQRGSAVTADRDIYESTAIAASKALDEGPRCAARPPDAASTSTAST